MSPVLAHLLILWAVCALVLTVIFTVQRRGKLFKGLPYAGIFGFIGAAFGVIIGLTTFFASQHYSNVRQAAEREATSLGQIAALSGSFPHAQGAAVRAQLYCYATDVIEDEWPKNSATGSPAVEGRERALYGLLLQVGRGNPRPSSWYSSALNSSLAAGEQRQDRLLLSAPQIPVQLWILLYLGGALTVMFAFFFHLPSRGQLYGMTAAVVVMLTAVVGVLAAMDSPTEGPFGLQPDAMKAERALLVKDLPPSARDAGSYCARLPVPRGEPAVLL